MTNDADAMQARTTVVDMTPEDVLRFWFADSVADRTSPDEDFGRWFGRDVSFDRRIRDCFGADIARARHGELDAWKASARGRLALIILLDQMPRNAFRGSVSAFASDWRAAQYCRDGLELGADGELAAIERLFFYLPLLHSEQLPDQRRSVQCFEQLLACAPTVQARHFAAWVRLARRSCRTIEWFGRFPHRNAICGRKSRPAERAFLALKMLLGLAAKLCGRLPG